MNTIEGKCCAAFRAFLDSQDEAAEKLYLSALEQMQEAGVEDTLTVECLHSLARICISSERFADAESYFVRGLAICGKLDPLDDLQASLLQSQLGDLYRFRKRYDEAEGLIVSSIRLGEAAMGADSQFLDCALRYYAELLKGTGRDAEAESVEARMKQLRPISGERNLTTP